MTDKDRAALAIRTAADLLATAAALIELDDGPAALRHLSAVRGALTQAASAGDDWAEVARVIDAALAPTLAPGLALGAAAFGAWQQTDTPEARALLAEWADTAYLEDEADEDTQARARAEELN